MLTPVIDSSYIVPGMDKSVYSMQGDIILGGIFRIHKYSDDEVCSEKVQSQKYFQYPEAFVHSIHYINKMDAILPNISLGFTILDTCTTDQVCSLNSLRIRGA